MKARGCRWIILVTEVDGTQHVYGTFYSWPRVVQIINALEDWDELRDVRALLVQGFTS